MHGAGCTFHIELRLADGLKGSRCAAHHEEQSSGSTSALEGTAKFSCSGESRLDLHEHACWQAVGSWQNVSGCNTRMPAGGSGLAESAPLALLHRCHQQGRPLCEDISSQVHDPGQCCVFISRGVWGCCNMLSGSWSGQPAASPEGLTAGCSQKLIHCTGVTKRGCLAVGSETANAFPWQYFKLPMHPS